MDGESSILKPKRRGETFARMLTSEDAYATTLITIVIDEYGTEALSWAPETLKLELQDDFNVELPAANFNKIMAAVALLTTNYFYASLPRFIHLCNVLSDSDFNPLIFDPADSLEVAWAITEAMLMDPPDDLENAFANDIRHYIGAVTSAEGYVNLPDVLALAIRNLPKEDPLGYLVDDPSMYSAFWQTQQSMAADLNYMLKSRLAELIEQMEQLPLANGDSTSLLRKMRRELQEKS